MLGQQVIFSKGFASALLWPQGEILILTGRSITSPQEACAAVAPIHALEVRNILLSLGKAGALLSTGEQVWLAKPSQIKERNPIGAGDASVAGLV